MKPAAAAAAPCTAGRRSALQRGAVWAALTALGPMVAGCGFRLRGDRPLPFERLAIVGLSPGSALGPDIRRHLGTRARLVDSPAQADAVLTIETATRQKFVTGLTSTGLVREMVLRLTFRFRLSTPSGRDLLPSTQLVLQRDLATNEGAALAKAREEDEIFRVLERDVVQQMVRRLEAVPPGGTGSVPVAPPSPTPALPPAPTILR